MVLFILYLKDSKKTHQKSAATTFRRYSIESFKIWMGMYSVDLDLFLYVMIMV